MKNITKNIRKTLKMCIYLSDGWDERCPIIREYIQKNSFNLFTIPLGICKEGSQPVVAGSQKRVTRNFVKCKNIPGDFIHSLFFFRKLLSYGCMITLFSWFLTCLYCCVPILAVQHTVMCLDIPFSLKKKITCCNRLHLHNNQ